MPDSSPHSEPETMDAFQRLGEWLECERRGSDAPRHYDPRNDIGSLLEQLEACEADRNSISKSADHLQEQLEAAHAARDEWRGDALAATQQLADLQEQLEAVRQAAEWEQEHGGCFCRACNEAVGASSPASERDK